jgi:hypothetical protein
MEFSQKRIPQSGTVAVLFLRPLISIRISSLIPDCLNRIGCGGFDRFHANDTYANNNRN